MASNTPSFKEQQRAIKPKDTQFLTGRDKRGNWVGMIKNINRPFKSATEVEYILDNRGCIHRAQRKG
jgi:gamma-glutamyltranspeptidase